MLIPKNICDVLHFSYHYPVIAVTPWNEEVKNKIEHFCLLLKQYAHYEYWATELTAFEASIEQENIPYKNIMLRPSQMDRLYALLSDIHSKDNSPEGVIHYYLNHYGERFYKGAQAFIEEIMTQIKNAPLENNSQLATLGI